MKNKLVMQNLMYNQFNIINMQINLCKLYNSVNHNMYINRLINNIHLYIININQILYISYIIIYIFYIIKLPNLIHNLVYTQYIYYHLSIRYKNFEDKNFIIDICCLFYLRSKIIDKKYRCFEKYIIYIIFGNNLKMKGNFNIRKKCYNLNSLMQDTINIVL